MALTWAASLRSLLLLFRAAAVIGAVCGHASAAEVNLRATRGTIPVRVPTAVRIVGINPLHDNVLLVYGGKPVVAPSPDAMARIDRCPTFPGTVAIPVAKAVPVPPMGATAQHTHDILYGHLFQLFSDASAFAASAASAEAELISKCVEAVSLSDSLDDSLDRDVSDPAQAISHFIAPVSTVLAGVARLNIAYPNKSADEDIALGSVYRAQASDLFDPADRVNFGAQLDVVTAALIQYASGSPRQTTYVQLVARLADLGTRAESITTRSFVSTQYIDCSRMNAELPIVVAARSADSDAQPVGLMTLMPTCTKLSLPEILLPAAFGLGWLLHR